MNVQRHGDVTIVSLTRSACAADASALTELKDELFTLVDGPNEIVLDFASVEQLSSAALGALITFQKHARQVSSRVHFCNLRAEIANVFKITRLDRLFEIYKDRGSAIHGF